MHLISVVKGRPVSRPNQISTRFGLFWREWCGH